MFEEREQKGKMHKGERVDVIELREKIQKCLFKHLKSEIENIRGFKAALRATKQGC